MSNLPGIFCSLNLSQSNPSISEIRTVVIIKYICLKFHKIMKRIKSQIMMIKGTFFSLSLVLFLSSFQGISQNMLPYGNDIRSHKISTVIASKTMVMANNIKKIYVDSVKFDQYGRLVEKHIKAYDTSAEREYAGNWTYTYDSAGNRALETRKSPNHEVMDYFNYVYDSSRIKKQIWVYWVNMKLSFNRIYEVKYDGSGRLNMEIVKDGTEKVDSVLQFKYDARNRINEIVCTSDKDFKDTINKVDYSFNPDGSVAKTVTTSKALKSIEENTYDQNKKLIKHASNEETTTYMYDKTGLLNSSEVTIKNKKGMKYKYTYTYLYR
jgi:hypothetical protein